MSRRRRQRRRIPQRRTQDAGHRPDDAGQKERRRFPIAAVNEIIDGRTLIAAHGTREMPIWGFDVMVRNRIVEIVDYLNRIQAK
jgi:hypothetical protein